MSSHFKDHFSKQSSDYSSYRPHYPADLFTYLAQCAPNTERAWDCATGTGQAALALAQHFREVIATDASEKQITNATPGRGISYRVATGEDSGLAAESVDLITVAQALHWFDQERFYAEVRRVARPQGVIAAWCYGLFRLAPDIDGIIYQLYEDIVGRYWPPERRYIEQAYRTLAFPFEELSPPVFEMHAQWSLDQVLGYLGTWSAVQRYKDDKGDDLLLQIRSALQQAWDDPDATRTVTWPLALRLGVVKT